MKDYARIIVAVDNSREDKISAYLPSWIDFSTDLLSLSKAKNFATPQGEPDIVVFIDGNYEQGLKHLEQIVTPICQAKADLVVGTRNRQIKTTSNSIACHLTDFLWQRKLNDIGPLCAFSYSLLHKTIRNTKINWGWEILLKALGKNIAIEKINITDSVPFAMDHIHNAPSAIRAIAATSLQTHFKRNAAKIPRQLSLFTRYPVPGEVKTRLIPTLGPQLAANLQKDLTFHMVKVMKKFTCLCPSQTEIRFSGGNLSQIKKWLGPDLVYKPQRGENLGERMHQCFVENYINGIQKTIIIGADCPEISEEILEKAFFELEDNDLIIGPAFDGGYYLIGLKRPTPSLFKEIRWGELDVLDTTLDRAEKLGLKVALLPPLGDVDYPRDLKVWSKMKSSIKKGAHKTISIIIPTLNEQDNIGPCIKSIVGAKNVQVIVVDGNSEDDTAQLAMDLGVRVYFTEKPQRAKQMNLGAEYATGDILLFLHADTLLPKGFDKAIRHALWDPKVVAGAFELTIDNAKFDNVANWTNKRARSLQMPYGDQAIFVRNSTFYKLGKYQEIPIMEDFKMMQRLRRFGKIAILSQIVLTSDRRWAKLGPWRTTMINQMMVAGHHLGVPPEQLADMYRIRTK